MTRRLNAAAFGLALAGLLIVAIADTMRAQPDRPIVIAHRGASGYLPEHTLAAYDLAMTQGADYIEPDLVSTRDGVLVARHEVNITETTDVAERAEFASRRTTKTIDGAEETGWFADDFTLAELETLRATQRVPFRSQAHNGKHPVPTFDEVIALAQRRGRELGRTIGIYPETKHPTYHRQRGLALEEKIVAALAKAGWNAEDAPVFIQSFEVANLRRLSELTPVRLVQLIDASGAPYDFRLAGDSRTYADLLSPKALADMATYAAGIGPNKRRLVDNRGEAIEPSLVRAAHAAGLIVHPWTFRNEPTYLAAVYKGDPMAEYLAFFRMGVDGLFSDFPDTAFEARERHFSR
jgi:glycerophosphoryl diester phosphodiesterase